MTTDNYTYKLPSASGYSGVLGMAPTPNKEAFDAPTVLQTMVTQGLIDEAQASFVLMSPTSGQSVQSRIIFGSSGPPAEYVQGDSGTAELSGSSATWNLAMEGIQYGDSDSK